MIHWVNLKGRQFYGTLGQALPPVSAVTKGPNPLSLLLKQVGRLGPWCTKTVCPSNSPSGNKILNKSKAIQICTKRLE